MTAPWPVEGVRGRWLEDLPDSPWRWFGLPGWLFWRPIIAIRNVAWDRVLTPTRLPVPVIAIGNLTAGGTGKTPAVRLVCGLLAQLGLKPAVLMRGYRAAPGETVNDEARELAEWPVVSDPDRVRGGRKALADGADCLVLDDGFQHRRLHRDLDLVLIDATRPWGAADGGRGAVLPLGFRREGLSGLARAQAFWLSRAGLVPPERITAIRARLPPDRLIIQDQLGDLLLEPLTPGLPQTTSLPLPTSSPQAGQPVVLASGIGNPANFAATALAAGLTIARELRFPDHHRYDARDVAILANRVGRAAGSGSGSAHAGLVITGKDAVKLRDLLPPALAARTSILHGQVGLGDVQTSALRDLLRQTLAAAGASARSAPRTPT